MSSKYLLQKRGGKGKDIRALDSTSSITGSATTTEPTAVPWEDMNVAKSVEFCTL